VGKDFLDVAGDREPAGDLAPRDLDQGVELGVVGPGRFSPPADRLVRCRPAVVGDDVEVVSPGEVRADLATVAAAVVARYA
jgi:hypothetical protein